MAEVDFTKDGNIARVHLNRPQGLNAITGVMDDLL
jgi:enoyl-CoA hydratase/carnithine racemase